MECLKNKNKNKNLRGALSHQTQEYSHGYSKYYAYCDDMSDHLE